MLAPVFGQMRIIGVASSGTYHYSGYHAPTFLKVNSDFLRAELTPGAPWSPPDVDGDQVPDIADNCRLDANTDQLDRDEDGVGDVCDNCTPMNVAGVGPRDLTTFEPDPGFAAFHNPDQANCNEDAEAEELRALDPTFIDPATGAPRRVSWADYNAVVPAGNLCAHEYAAELRRVRRGDACDPVPCGDSTVELAPVDPALAPPFVCVTPSHIAGMCRYLAPAGLGLGPKGTAPAAQGLAGVRYCKCLKDHGTEGERKLNCGGGLTVSDCGVDVNRYSPAVPDASWYALSLNAIPPSLTFELGMAFGPSAPDTSVLWNALADLSLLNNGAALPAPPWTASTFTADGEFAAGPVLRGIAWTHVPYFAGLPTKDALPAPGFRPIAPLASNYRPADVRFVVEMVGGQEMPSDGPAFPWTYCAECNLGPDMQWLWVMDAALSGRVLSIGSAHSIEVSSWVSSEARALLASGALRVPASEPDYRLAQAGLARREILIDKTSDALPVIGSLGVQGGHVVGALRSAAVPGDPAAAFADDAALPPAGTEALGLVAAGQTAEGAPMDSGDLTDGQPIGISGEDPARVLAYSALRNEAFALVREPGQPTRLRRWSAATGTWMQQATSGTALGVPIAMVFHFEQGALFTLDQPDDDAKVTRLLRIDLATGEVRVLAPELLVGPYGARSLTMAHGGSLLLAATREDGAGAMQLAHLDVAGGKLGVLDRFEKGSTQASHVRENARGVHYLTKTQRGYVPERVALDAFTPADSATVDPVFP